MDNPLLVVLNVHAVTQLHNVPAILRDIADQVEKKGCCWELSNSPSTNWNWEVTEKEKVDKRVDVQFNDIVGWSNPVVADLGFDVVYSGMLHLSDLRIVQLGVKDDAKMVYRGSVIQKAILRDKEACGKLYPSCCGCVSLNSKDCPRMSGEK